MKSSISKFLSQSLSKFTPAYWKELKKEKEEAEQKKAWAKRVGDAKLYNAELIESIIANCPAGNVLLIKFRCGNWFENQLREVVPEMVKNQLSCKSRWYYPGGSGFLAINPDFYKRDPKLIVDALWAPSHFLEGEKIWKWYYVSESNVA